MSVKDINIKNQTYYFFYDIIYIENFDPKNIKIDEKSYKNILIYYIRNMTIKKDLNMCNVNHMYLIFGEVNGYFEKINENKYFTPFLLMKANKKIKKYEELWSKIGDLITSITKNPYN